MHLHWTEALALFAFAAIGAALVTRLLLDSAARVVNRWLDARDRREQAKAARRIPLIETVWGDVTLED